MSALVVVGQKFKVNSELSYQKKSCSECQQDVRKQYFSMSICPYVNMSTCPYVNMSICQNATFQLRYQNESCSKCHQEKVVKECERVRESKRERVSE